MTEKTEQEENTEEEKQSSSTMIDRATDAAERLERANEEMEKQIQKLETLNVEAKLAGRTAAGQPPAKEETPEEYTDKIMAGDEKNE